MADQAEQASPNTQIPANDVHLDDDKQPKEDQFVGATLQISGDGVPRVPDVEFSGQGIDRNRPGSTMSRRSAQSTGSRTSRKPYGYKSEKASEMFFSYKVVKTL